MSLLMREGRRACGFCAADALAVAALEGVRNFASELHSGSCLC